MLRGVETTSFQSVVLIEKIVSLMDETKEILKANFSKFYSLSSNHKCNFLER